MSVSRDELPVLFVTFFSKRREFYEKKKGEHEGSMIPPLGLLYISSYIKQYGYENVRLVDFSVDSLTKDEFGSLLRSFDPALVGISVYAETHDWAVALSRYVKSVLPGTRIMYGGAQATFTAGELLDDGAGDFVCMGEGEVTTFELLEAMRCGERRSFHHIDGLAWKDATGTVRMNGPRKSIRPLDALPFPDRELLIGKGYVETCTVITGRGCTGDCAFCCSRAFWGAGARFRSAENTYGEIRRLHDTGEDRRGYNTRGWFFIMDDAFTIRRSRVARFCGLLMRDGIGMRWGCHSRLDDLDVELLETMRDAGCQYIELGIESYDQKTLDDIGKNIDLSRLERILAAARALGVAITCSFIIGFPRDTKETMRKNVQFAIDLWERHDLATVTLAFNTPFPGTVFYTKADELGLRITAHRWSQFAMDNPIVESDTFSVDDLAEVFAGYQQYLRSRFVSRGRYRREPVGI
jgi:radical SAM superfamily enzyme YgiQ (UPF0313 family)